MGEGGTRDARARDQDPATGRPRCAHILRNEGRVGRERSAQPMSMKPSTCLAIRIAVRM
ncbi:hypothetical protein ACFQZ4_45235 [Catellatospora coxensis]